jgi:myo-inositol-1(or 4)-monophosphatase
LERDAVISSSLARELRSVAEACARTGGAVLRDATRDGLGLVREKAPNDFVTEVDTASEAAIAAFLREHRPGDDLLAEEAASAASSLRPRAIGSNGAHGGPSDAATTAVPGRVGAADCVSDVVRTGVAWIVDPLDGTKNFIHGYPMYGVSVAARDADGLLAGAVYDPTRDEMFTASRGEGAALNGAPIHVTAVEIRGALVGTGFPFRHTRLREAYLESFRLVSGSVSDVRRAGSAALDLAYVACGRLDGFWELGLSPWDMAGGWLLIEEAGGRVSDDRGGSEVFERGHIVAGGAAVHAALLDLVRPAFDGKVLPLAALRA